MSAEGREHGLVIEGFFNDESGGCLAEVQLLG
jgi:hypothetical protein